MQWIKNTKRGAYILEAVIVVPIFIIAVMMLISIIPMIASCENIIFSTVDEMKQENIKANFRKNPVALSTGIRYRIYEENKNISVWKLNRMDYIYSSKGIDDLISIEFKTVFSEKNPLGLFSSVIFEGKVTSRAFTGRVFKQPPTAREEFEVDKEEQWVYIFPQWGKRYHGKTCTYVSSACQMSYLSQDLKRRYSPCRLCNAKSAQVGTPVFCFVISGQVYHKAGCRIIDKYYIQIEKKDAKAKGYSPCSKCGGM